MFAKKRAAAAVILSVAALRLLKSNNNSETEDDDDNIIESKRYKRENSKPEDNFHYTLMDWKENDVEKFESYVKMSVAQFDELLMLVTPIIQKQNTQMRLSVSASERLIIALSVIYHGHTYSEMNKTFKVSKALFTEMLPEVFSAIYEVLKDKHMRLPTDEDEWLSISAEFEEKFIFPRCIGVLDSKYLTHKKSKVTTITMKTLVDSNKRFRCVDFYENDVCLESDNCLPEQITRGQLDLPNPQPIIEGGEPVPFVFVATESFENQSYLVKPFLCDEENYRNQVFNGGLHNTFEASDTAYKNIISRYEILKTPFKYPVSYIKQMMRAIFVLYNYHLDTTLLPESEIFPERSDCMPENNLLQSYSNNKNSLDDSIRSKIADYFVEYCEQEQFQIITKTN